jgi:hypothetical protein
LGMGGEFAVSQSRMSSFRGTSERGQVSCQVVVGLGHDSSFA